MNVTFVKWKNWDAVKCVVSQYELTVGISAGPRILSFGREGGQNFLYEDDTDFCVGKWRLYGGHRFTVAPETDESYYPDNDACEVKQMDSKLHISANQRPNGIRLSIAIGKGSGEDGFEIQHILENNGQEEWTGALWAITCVPRSAQLLVSCNTPEIHFWPGTDPTQWQKIKEQITVKSGDFRGKAGWHTEHPVLAAVQQQGTLLLSNADLSVPEACVDNGCNTEVFVCKDFSELETLSERIFVAPGESAAHLQQWQLQP